MSTTSLKLPDDLKLLAAAAARQQGMTPHAFMVEAIRVATLAAEQRAQFVADAAASRAEALQTGRGIPAEEVHAHLRAQAEGRAQPRPKARSWRS